ncbi:S-adenosyl-L-methionine-dependent methyltransferase [Frankia sp. AiPs1]|uniref:SAM-dependent methyltransferase n=1 Tax=Frankia sp. AiPa1 TaxID=573492 RepID=UPI00202B2C4F|nr:SAM-dependent methyltransferase [Frankia sp. AiPa1]MCL9760984.1 SAM-dependent methyltransferase [Frankia sp. AiPa1]
MAKVRHTAADRQRARTGAGPAPAGGDSARQQPRSKGRPPGPRKARPGDQARNAPQVQGSPRIPGSARVEDWDITSGVGITALAVAAGRAIESQRPDAMADDPFAAAFVRAADLPSPMPTSLDDLADLSLPDSWLMRERYLGVRTKYLDAVVEAATRAGIRQTVILAAGLDTRAFRMRWPAGSTVFEIDQPRVLSFKLAVLADLDAPPACRHRPVPVDLRDDWAFALRAAGFVQGTPTLWLAEGIVPYLTADAEQRLLATVDALSAPGSRIAVEEPRRILETVSDAELAEALSRWGVDLRALLQDDDGRDVAAALGALGWEVATDSFTEVAARYGHTFPPDFTVTGDASRFVTAIRPRAHPASSR